MKYDNEQCNTFVRECEEAGFEVEHYHGRFWWEGPAVRCEDRWTVQDLIRSTTMHLQHDQLGLGWIYYPVASGKLTKEERLDYD